VIVQGIISGHKDAAETLIQLAGALWPIITWAGVWQVKWDIAGAYSLLAKVVHSCIMQQGWCWFVKHVFFVPRKQVVLVPKKQVCFDCQQCMLTVVIITTAIIAFSLCLQSPALETPSSVK
jgi:hypothetical protein